VWKALRIWALSWDWGPDLAWSLMAVHWQQMNCEPGDEEVEGEGGMLNILRLENSPC